MNSIMESQITALKGLAVQIESAAREHNLTLFDQATQEWMNIIRELRAQVDWQESNALPETLEDRMRAGRLRVLMGGESPSD